MDEDDYYDYNDCMKSTFDITLGSGFDNFKKKFFIFDKQN